MNLLPPVVAAEVMWCVEFVNILSHFKRFLPHEYIFALSFGFILFQIINFLILMPYYFFIFLCCVYLKNKFSSIHLMFSRGPPPPFKFVDKIQ